MESKELILILDFGGQYNQLIARRVRECNVYSEVVPYDISLEKIKEKNPKGIIFTGGPASVYYEDSPKCAEGIFELGIPVLGICYGMQLMSHTLGGNVLSADTREFGETSVSIDNTSPLFQGFDNTNIFLMSHTDYVIHFHLDSKKSDLHQTALMQLWKMLKRNYMEFNSIQK